MRFSARLKDGISFIFGQKTAISMDGLNSHFNRVNGGPNSTSAILKNSTDFLNAYQLISYVGKNIHILAGDIAALDYYFEDASDKEVENPKLKMLFDEPNSLQSGYEFRYTLMAHLLLDGNYFILPDTTNMLDISQGKPTAIYILNPALVDIYDTHGQIVTSTTKTNSFKISHYLCTIGMKQYRFDHTDLIHVKLPSPHNSMRGMGIVQINATSMESDKLQTILNNAFLKSGASSNMLVTPAEEMGVAQYKMFKDQFLSEYTGSRNWFKPIFAPYGSKVSEMQIKHTDMQYIEQKAFTREDIDTFFGIPPIVSGSLGNAKYDTAGEQIKIYNTRVLPRWAELLSCGFNVITAPFNQEFELDIPESSDPKEQNLIAKDLFDRGSINGNEYRVMIGMDRRDDVDSLEEFFIGVNYIPVSDASMPALPAGKAYDSKAFRQSRQMSSRQRAIHASATRTKKVIQKHIYKSIIKFYAELKRTVLEDLEKNFDQYSKKALSEDMFNAQAVKADAVKSARSFFTSAVALGIKDVNESFNMSIDPTFKNNNVKLTVERLSKRYAEKTIDTRRNELRKIVTDGLSEGESVQTIKASVEDWVDTLVSGQNAWRADRIARTEASYAWDQASKIAYDELNVESFDVVGCEDNETDCNVQNVPMAEWDNLDFHPNHTGTRVPNL